MAWHFFSLPKVLEPANIFADFLLVLRIYTLLWTFAVKCSAVDM